MREACPGLLELRLERALIDDVEHVALLHASAVNERLSLEQSRHLTSDLDGIRRLRLADEFVVDR